MKEHLSAARECLNIRNVFRQHGNDLGGKTVLAADVRQGSDHAMSVNDKEAFGLNVEAQGRGILDKNFGVCPGKNGPDAGGNFAKLRAGLKRRMAVAFEQHKFWNLPDRQCLIPEASADCLKEQPPSELAAVRNRFERDRLYRKPRQHPVNKSDRA